MCLEDLITFLALGNSILLRRFAFLPYKTISFCDSHYVFMELYMKLLTGIFLVILTTPVLAGVIRDDVDDSAYRDIGNYFAFDSVGAIIGDSAEGAYGCSGTAIDTHWVLTAAHCVDKATSLNFYLRDATGAYTSHTGINWFANENWNGSNLLDGWDIGLINVSDSLDVAPAQIYRGNNEFLNIGVSVGFGLSGNGLTGDILPFGTKRGGFNSIDDVWSAAGNFDQMLWSDFDSPTDPAYNFFSFIDPTLNTSANPFEYAIAPGDSGGGVFILENNQLYLAGVHSIGADINGDSLVDYGDIYASTRVSSFASWIDEKINPIKVPESNGLPLLLIALGGIFCLRARKSANA